MTTRRSLKYAGNETWVKGPVVERPYIWSAVCTETGAPGKWEGKVIFAPSDTTRATREPSKRTHHKPQS